MRKLIYLFVVCSLTTVATAQKVTEKELQGNWKLAGLNANGITLDMKTETVTISEELKAQLTPDMITQINDGMKQAVTPLKNSSTVFTGSNVKQIIAGQEKSGTYTVASKDNVQSISYKWSDGTTTEEEVSLKDKQLLLTKSQQGQSAVFIYSKE